MAKSDYIGRLFKRIGGGDDVDAAAEAEEIARGLLDATKRMFEAHDSYSNEFNPSGKVRKVANWGLINSHMVAARVAINRAEGK